LPYGFLFALAFDAELAADEFDVELELAALAGFIADALAAFAMVFAALAIALAAALAAVAAWFAALAIALAAVFIAFAALLALAALLLAALSPQAIPRAPIARTAERAITFFISKNSPVFFKD
jgi:hypothetical protein